MSNIIFTGIMPALITPFTKEGEIIKQGIKDNMNRNFDQGASGFYICGSTGEGPVLTVDQRKIAAETIMDVNNGRGKIINHVGAASPYDAFELARHAGKIGCDAISSVVPNFYYKYNDDEIIEYYKRLADESGIPVLAYAQNLLTSDPVNLMERLIKIDGIVGVKFTLVDYYAMRRIKELNGGDINVINGPDEMLICGLTMGADGGIGSTYNLMCAEYVKLYNLFKSGDFEGAKAVQYKVNHVVEILLKHNCLKAIKYVLNYMGIESGDVMYPGTPYSEEEAAQLIKELTDVGYFDNYNK